MKQRIVGAFLADRSAATQAAEFAASLPEDYEWRRVIEQWVASDAPYLIAVDLPGKILVGTPEDLTDLRAMVDLAREEDRGAQLQLKVMCSEVTAAAVLEVPGLAVVNWMKPPTRH